MDMNYYKQYEPIFGEWRITRQLGDDGVYRKVETSNYFVKCPATEDVLIISLCNNFADGEEA